MASMSNMIVRFSISIQQWSNEHNFRRGF